MGAQGRLATVLCRKCRKSFRTDSLFQSLCPKCDQARIERLASRKENIPATLADAFKSSAP